MGTWGEGYFDNDAALDWAIDLERAGDRTKFLLNTLMNVDESIAVHVAAIAVVAAARNRWSDLSPFGVFSYENSDVGGPFIIDERIKATEGLVSAALIVLREVMINEEWMGCHDTEAQREECSANMLLLETMLNPTGRVQ